MNTEEGVCLQVGWCAGQDAIQMFSSSQVSQRQENKPPGLMLSGTPGLPRETD